MGHGSQGSESGLNPACGTASPCPWGAGAIPQPWGQQHRTGERPQGAGPAHSTRTWCCSAPVLSHSNCRARALCSHFLSPTQELGNLDPEIAPGILNSLISHR